MLQKIPFKKNMIQCKICGKFFNYINNSHLKTHNITPREYKEKYGEIISKEFKNNMRNSKIGHISYNKGKTLEELHGEEKAKEIKEKISNKSKSYSREIRKKININQKKYYFVNKNPLFGKTYEEFYGLEKATKEKLKRKESRFLSVLLNDGKWPNYNKNSIPIFKEFKRINNLKNCYFATEPHEWYIKELCYTLDFIDFDLKLIIEIDEKHHFDKSTGNLKEKDIIRQKEIQEFFPDFKFLRFKEEEMEKILNILQESL